MTRLILIGGMASARRLLRYSLEFERDIEIVCELDDATDGDARLVAEAAPHAIAMDTSALTPSGLRLIEEIMAERPLPIVILSEIVHAANGGAVTQALQRGALLVQRWPSHPDPDEAAALRETVRLIAKIPVVRHPRSRPTPQQRSLPQKSPPLVPPITPFATPTSELIGIGSSAGGPATLVDILSALPADFAACVLVVQHLPSGFAGLFAGFLRSNIRLPVHIAGDPLAIAPGRVIVAPDDAHLVITGRGQCAGERGAPINGHRPSVDRLFHTMAESYGAAALGIVLSGIGNDGTAGLRAIREKGGLTIAQDGQSAIVNGMPRAASESGAASLCLAPAAIAQTLLDACRPPPRGDSDAN